MNLAEIFAFVNENTNGMFSLSTCFLILLITTVFTKKYGIKSSFFFGSLLSTIVAFLFWVIGGINNWYYLGIFIGLTILSFIVLYWW